jgi:hypothetical protein
MEKINDWFSIEKKNKNITIVFNDNPTYEDYNEYLIYYDNLYSQKKYITILFDCSNINYFPINYIYKIVVLMCKMEKTHLNYLEKFTIKVTNPKIKTLINLVFDIHPPVVNYEIINN